MIRPLAMVPMLLLLAACAGAPQRPAFEGLLQDQAFNALPDPPPTADIFRITPEMRRFLDGPFATQVRRMGPKRALIEALHSEVRLQYDAERTRDAGEAFAARAGNCLSLAIVTGALAGELGVPVVYQSVYGEEAWSRDGSLAFRSEHVNLVLGEGNRHWRAVSGTSVTIDFLPPAAVTRQWTTPISQERVIAMFQNNRAAELLAGGDVNAAYWWSRAALHSDPTFVSAYNTLGVVYDRRDLPGPAERSFRFALALEPENASMLGNLARVLARQGRMDEARGVRERLAEVQPYPPFYFLDRGMEALHHGDNLEALRLFIRERQRMPYQDEVQFGMALASLRLGEIENAREYLSRAADFSPTQGRKQIYASKLAKLRQLGRGEGGDGPVH